MQIAGSGERLLLIASREPAPGATKTRLGATIGMEAAASLHRAFLRDLAARFTPRHRGWRMGWAFSPPECDFHAVMTAISGAEAIDGALFVPQAGDDWAIRQFNLLRWGYDQGYHKTVLVGSDSPQLPTRTIHAAFVALDSADLVLGPVHDGGYYLIGMREPHDVLTGVTMSTRDVLASVHARAAELGLKTVEVEATFDVDVEADLRLLVDVLCEDPTIAPATHQTLQQLGYLPGVPLLAVEELPTAV